MIAQDYLDFCETLWTDWLAERIELPKHVSRRFQLDHAPEPYLRFGVGTKPLYVLFTNPGKGLELQRRDDIIEGKSPVNSCMTYDEASRAFAKYYFKNLTSGARDRNNAMIALAEEIGADCIVQFESIPFHSRSLPGKARIPELVEETDRLKAYTTHLADAMKDVSVVAVSAVDTSKPISRDSVADNPWLSWQASLLGIQPKRLQVKKLAEKGGQVTRAFLYQRVAGHVRGFVLTMGTNSFPGPAGRGILARAIMKSLGKTGRMNKPMERIESEFKKHFANWSVRLPRGDVANRKRGVIGKAGWNIQYLFGSDEKGEYLDYYARHRMTNDSHVRIFANGKVENLPAFLGMRLSSEDSDEDKRLAAAHRAEDERIAITLKAKGFL